jgi:hypothetical protein
MFTYYSLRCGSSFSLAEDCIFNSSAVVQQLEGTPFSGFFLIAKQTASSLSAA